MEINKQFFLVKNQYKIIFNENDGVASVQHEKVKNGFLNNKKLGNRCQYDKILLIFFILLNNIYLILII